MSTSQYNSTPTCSNEQPYALPKNSPNNTCTWRTTNYTSSTQTAISNCCGPGNTPYPYSPYAPGIPPGCFQMCNITNGTYEQIYQNMDVLRSCLSTAGAGDVNCHWLIAPVSGADGLRGAGGSWAKMGVWVLLAGTVVWGL
jgi:hypothetical protein